jgi:phosphoribosylaminoimidazole-succinocarboxamide synthase
VKHVYSGKVREPCQTDDGVLLLVVATGLEART